VFEENPSGFPSLRAGRCTFRKGLARKMALSNEEKEAGRLQIGPLG
jgi:hypothetical protein